MAETPDPQSFCVVDNFLDEDTWTRLWSDFQFMELSPVSRSVGAWKLDDGIPLGGDELVVPRTGAASSGETPLGQVARAILDNPEIHADLVDDDWDRISVRPYVYSQGTGLSWHVDDHQLFAGAFVYYAHPHWNAHWGGELLVGDVESESDDELQVMGYRFETEPYSERLLEPGLGSFVMPKPNRLVLLSGAPHMIARVHPAAGASVRASVSGFFLRTSR